MIDFPPWAILIIGAALVPFLKGKIKNWYVILLPAAAFLLICQLEIGASWKVHFFGFDLTFLRVDKLSKVFGYIFTINAVAAFVYAFELKDDTQHLAALFYIGSSLGVVFAGDVVSLYFFWEIMAVASTFLILARKTEKAQTAAMRYILVHIFGGLCLLAGIIMYITQTGSVDFNPMTDRNWGTYLILIGILINAAAPPRIRMAAGCLSGVDRHRRRNSQRLHHQNRGLHTGTGFSGMEDTYRHRMHHGHIRCYLRPFRK